MNKIELTDEQLKLVSKALEMYTRMSIGQFLNAAELSTTVRDRTFQMDNLEKRKFEISINTAASILTGINGNGNYGIYNEKVKDDARMAAHINQSINHEFWKRDGNNVLSVHSHPADIVKGLEIKIEKI